MILLALLLIGWNLWAEDLPPVESGPVTRAQRAIAEEWDQFWDLTYPTSDLLVWKKKKAYRLYLEAIDYNWSLGHTNEQLDLQTELFGLAWVGSFNLSLTDNLKPEDLFLALVASFGQ